MQRDLVNMKNNKNINNTPMYGPEVSGDENAYNRDIVKINKLRQVMMNAPHITFGFGPLSGRSNSPKMREQSMNKHRDDSKYRASQSSFKNAMYSQNVPIA